MDWIARNRAERRGTGGYLRNLLKVIDYERMYLDIRSYVWRDRLVLYNNTPKADLHVHLNGAVPSDVVASLAQVTQLGG